VHRQVASVLETIWSHPSNKDDRIRRVLLASYFQLKGRLFKRPLIVQLGNSSRIYAHLHFSASSDVVYANPPARDLLVWSRNLKSGDRFLDVGASVGVYSIWALEQGATVIAVEPNPTAASLYRQNMKLNGYGPELVEAAVADRPGQMSMTFDLDVANHLVLLPDARAQHVDLVPVTTVDDLIGDRTFAGVKLDVEGTEMMALRGAQRALSEKRIGLLQIEWNYASMDVTGEDRTSIGRFLEGFGYGLYRADDNGLLSPLRNPPAYGPDVFARPT